MKKNQLNTSWICKYSSSSLFFLFCHCIICFFILICFLCPLGFLFLYLCGFSSFLNFRSYCYALNFESLVFLSPVIFPFVQISYIQTFKGCATTCKPTQLSIVFLFLHNNEQACKLYFKC